MRNLNINIVKYEATYLANELINYAINGTLFFLKFKVSKTFGDNARRFTIKLYTKKGERKHKIIKFRKHFGIITVTIFYYMECICT